ncbi:MAG: hypothetical protein B7Z10_04890 [Rhodobacterales bacterium 32-66-7]|nr:MAG: hypothetical protein B7Z31_10190 [Rhodobacterales bacterium 12-65-15]OYX25887.1 MAG: hypothetical protein B7Z10_04890 [Rhodobacterales bacterium 32-66-7]
MRVALALSLSLAQAGCVASAANPPVVAGALRVSNAGEAFGPSDGAAARRVADAQCGAKGVNSSIYDRFDRATGEWVYPGGCA